MSLRGDPEGENVKTLSVPSLPPNLENSAPVLSETGGRLPRDSRNQRKPLGVLVPPSPYRE